MRAIIAATLLLSAALSSSASAQGSAKTDLANGVTDTAIKLGWMGDETAGGASVELPNLRGLQAYAAYINARGGILGRQLQIINLDDKFTPEGGRINFRRLVNDDRVLAIANMGGSHISTPLAPSVADAKVPILFPVQTIDAQLNVPYFFNITSHFADQADVMVASAAKAVGGADKLKMFVARLNVPSGQEFDSYIQRSLAVQKGTYVGAATMSITQTDYTPTVIEIRRAMEKGANYVALHGSLRTALGVLAAVSKAGIKTPIVGIQAHASPELFLKAPADVIAQFSTVQSVLPPSDASPGAKDMLAFVAANPNFAEFAKEPYFAQGWLTGVFLKAAAERAAQANGGALTRQTLYDALKTKFDTGGLSCPLDFTTGDRHYTTCSTTIAWNGKDLIATEPFATARRFDLDLCPAGYDCATLSVALDELVAP